MFEKFIEENVERDIKHFELLEVLYSRYLEYCKFNSVKPIGRMHLLINSLKIELELFIHQKVNLLDGE